VKVFITAISVVSYAGGTKKHAILYLQYTMHFYFFLHDVNLDTSWIELAERDTVRCDA